MLLINKPIGITPLQAITAVKRTYPYLTNQKLGYAGRLDPMAEGLLLILVGKENKERDKYQALPKTYIFSVLFGITTDTYDILGIIKTVSAIPSSIEQQLPSVLLSCTGKQEQFYPPYSSKTVQGKPLFYWARQNKLSTISIPSKSVEIYTLSLKKIIYLPQQLVKHHIVSKISLLQGDFRQKEILEGWKTYFNNTSPMKYSVAQIEASCSSGTYIRSITNIIGNKLTSGAIAFSIKRTHIGEYSLATVLPVQWS